MTDFAALMLRSLPGIYRQKDDNSELARFLQLAASPLAETEASIGQLYADLFGSTARAELLPFIAALIAADVDPGRPVNVQRAALAEALPFYRSKGLAEPLERAVEAFTGWPTVTVDYSQVVARTPFIEALVPVARQRRRPVGVDADGSNRFYFDVDQRTTTLFDEDRGRAITAGEIDTLSAELVGTDHGFAIRESGVDLVGPRAPAPRPVIGADLSDFSAPRDASGAPLPPSPGQIAVDPVLGRLLFAAPVPLAGNLSVDFHQLAPASTPSETFDLRDAARMVQLGRSDDPAPYTIDLRSPERPSDRIGRTHFDNHGVFVTVGKRVENHPPTQLRFTPRDGFSFDDRPLADGDSAGTTLQLLDAIDGAPLTVARLAGHEADYIDTPRGFTIRAGGVSLLDPVFGSAARAVAARLGDLDNPTDAAGAPLELGAQDIAIDPELGRFVVNLDAFGVTAHQLGVSYALASAVRIAGAAPAVLDAASHSFAFAGDGSTAALRDAFDGTPLAIKLRLGAPATDVHGSSRGYRVFAGATDLSRTLTPVIAVIDGPVTAAAGQLLVDLDRGRFALPTTGVPVGVALTVEFSVADTASDNQIFDSLAQRLPRLVPAGVVPVIADTRKPFINLSDIELAAKAKSL